MVKKQEKRFFYVPIANEMARALDEIINESGRKYGVFDKNQLTREMLGDFIAAYERARSFPGAKERSRWKMDINGDESEK